MSEAATDLATKEGILAFLEDIRGGIRENLEATGQLVPYCVVLATKTDELGGRLSDLKEPSSQSVIAMFVSPETAHVSKDQFFDLVRELAVRSRAVGVLTISEVWLAMVPVDNQAEIDRVRRDGAVNAPDRKEGVMLMCEHRAMRSFTQVAFIERTADGKPKLSEFHDGEETEAGRFSNLFPREMYS